MTFEEFAAGRLPGVLRFAAVLTGDRALAEDLAQEVLIRAHSRWRTIGSLDRPEYYVRKMILNEFLHWRRREWRLIPSGPARMWIVAALRIMPLATPNVTLWSPSLASCPHGSAPCSRSAITRGSPISRSRTCSAASRARSAAMRPGRSPRCAWR